MRVRLTDVLVDPWTHSTMFEEKRLGDPEGVDHGGREFIERVYREYHGGDIVDVDAATAEHLVATGQGQIADIEE